MTTRHRLSRCAAFVAFGLLFVFGTSPPLAAQPRALESLEIEELEQLQDALDRAELAEHDGEWLDAKTAYLEVYAILGDPSMLMDAARCAAAGEQPEEAVRLYRDVLDDDGDSVFESRARAEIALLHERYPGSVLLFVDAPDAEVSVCGQTVYAIAGEARIDCASGEYAMVVSAPGVQTVETLVRVEMRQSVRVQLVMVSTSAATHVEEAAPVPTAEPALERPGRQAAGVATASVLALVSVSTAALGGVYLAEANQASKEYNRLSAPELRFFENGELNSTTADSRDDASRERSRALRRAGASFASAGVALAAAAATAGVVRHRRRDQHVAVQFTPGMRQSAIRLTW